VNKEKFKFKQRWRRKKRVRKKVIGTAERPRLTAYRSLRQVYAQLIDDDGGATLVAACSRTIDMGNKIQNCGNKQAAARVGKELADKALALGIRQVRFDRNGYKYHGRIRALTEAAKEAGLVF